MPAAAASARARRRGPAAAQRKARPKEWESPDSPSTQTKQTGAVAPQPDAGGLAAAACCGWLHCLRQLARSRGLSGLQLRLERLLEGRVLTQDALLRRVDLDRQRCGGKARTSVRRSEGQRCAQPQMTKRTRKPKGGASSARAAALLSANTVCAHSGKQQIPRRVGCRAAWDAAPRGMPRRVG